MAPDGRQDGARCHAGAPVGPERRQDGATRGTSCEMGARRMPRGKRRAGLVPILHEDAPVSVFAALPASASPVPGEPVPDGKAETARYAPGENQRG